MALQARPLLSHEIARLLTTCTMRNRALMWCCLGGGLRAAESAALRVGDVGQDGALEVHTAKGGEPRRVYLTGQALEAVMQWRATLEFKGALDPLFPSRKKRNGRPQAISGAAAVDLMKLLMEQAGVSNASSHSLRRTHAQRLEESGSNPRIIQRQLGHKQLTTTEVYLAAYPPNYRETIRELEFDLNV